MMMQKAIEPGGDRLQARGNHWLSGLARLKPGQSLESARAGLTLLARQIESEHREAEGNGFAAYTRPCIGRRASGVSLPRRARVP